MESKQETKMDKVMANKPARKMCSVISAVIGFFLLPIMITGIVDFYYEYLDKTTYWSLTNISLDKKDYKPCDTVIISGELDSKVTVLSNNISQIISDRVVNNRKLERSEYIYNTNNTYIKQEINPQHFTAFELPCPNETAILVPGVYYFEGVVSFQIKDQNKSYTWKSPRFTILPPETK